MIRVLIVDDSAFVRKALSRMLGSAGDIEVVGTAVDGQDGVEKVLELRPDVVTLDVKMPRLDGLEALRRIMSECPTAVLLLSSLTGEGADVTLRGLDLGALDFVDKSSVEGHMNLLSLADELVEKVRGLAKAQRRAPIPAPSAQLPLPEFARQRAELVVIGTSTGGPAALQTVIPALPADLRVPVLVVQHMPIGFTRSLAERLDQRSDLMVREARDGEPLAAGRVLIAPAGRHLKIHRVQGEARIHLDYEPLDALHRPSVDVSMQSAARAYGAAVLGVVLTGMGADGVEGLRSIRAAGGRTLAESEDTCVIYGMPKAAIEAGVVHRVAPLGRIADEIKAAV
ncbi:MAG: chemotaxis response regulator protein-glutamate methylesterase [Vicinamibacteria bacterium]